MNRRRKNHAKWTLLTVPVCAGALLLSVAQADEREAKSAEDILQSYVADFRHDPAAAKPVTLGVRVTGKGGGDWHVVVAGKKQRAREAEVTLNTGFPDQPTAYYELDLATLRKMDGEFLKRISFRLLHQFVRSLRRANSDVVAGIDVLMTETPGMGFVIRRNLSLVSFDKGHFLIN